MQISVLAAATSCFFRGRSQLDDLIFRGLADDVFTVEARVGTGKDHHKVRLYTQLQQPAQHKPGIYKMKNQTDHENRQLSKHEPKTTETIFGKNYLRWSV